MLKKFVWERWIDPLLSNIDDIEFPGYNIKDVIEDEDDYPIYNDNPENPVALNQEDQNKFPIHKIIPHKVMGTPFGMLSVTEHSSACSQFDFWNLHTNFDLTQNMSEILEKVPGVETLDIIGRYRARIGFPKSGLFNVTEVKKNIQNALIEVDDQNETSLDAFISSFDFTTFQTIKKMKKHVDANKENYCLWALPNGNVELITSKELNSAFEEKAKCMNYGYSVIGGEIYNNI